MTHGRRRAGRAGVLAVLLLLGTGGGLGYAWWTTTGDGASSSATGAQTAWDVDADPSVGSPLTPGGPTQTVDFVITNPSSGHQKLNLITVAVANADGSAWTAVAGCSSADYSVSITTAPAYDDVNPADTRSGQATVGMVNRNANQNNCVNATVPLYFHAS